MADLKKGFEAEAGIHRIRITLTSCNVKKVEDVCTKIVESGKKKQVKVSGPVRLPTKLLKITTRKAPSGNGTATFDRFEMRIHKRIVDLHSSADIVKDITNVTVAPGVEVEITVME